MLTADPADAVVDLTRRLVAFDSVNPGLVPGAVGEGPAARFVADRLSGSGFEVQLVPAPSDPCRMSVIAVRDGGQPGRTVVLNVSGVQPDVCLIAELTWMNRRCGRRAASQRSSAARPEAGCTPSTNGATWRSFGAIRWPWRARLAASSQERLRDT